MEKSKEMKKLIKEKIEELEERNTESRALVKLLDEKLDKKIIEDEKTMRTHRIFAIIQLKDILEKMEEI